jgi:hypothetical protein
MFKYSSFRSLGVVEIPQLKKSRGGFVTPNYRRLGEV